MNKRKVGGLESIPYRRHHKYELLELENRSGENSKRPGVKDDSWALSLPHEEVEGTTDENRDHSRRMRLIGKMRSGILDVLGLRWEQSILMEMWAHPLTGFLIQASKAWDPLPLVLKGVTFTCEIVISLISSSTNPVFPAGRRNNFATAV